MISFGKLQVRDFGPLGKVEIELRGQGLVLIKGDNCDTTAADSNGSGKSHIFKAIAWALYGDSLDGEKTDEVIRKGQKSALVAVDWIDDDGNNYDVVRSRTKAQTALELHINGEDKSGIVLKDTQAEIQRLLGMDFQAFTNTVLYGQGDIHHFADPATKDPERKAVLKRLLKLEALDAALKAVKVKASNAEALKTRLSNSLPVWEAKRDAINPAAWDAKIALLTSRTADLAKKTAKKPRLEGIKTQIESVLAGYEGTKKQIADGEARARTFDREAANERANATTARNSASAARSRLALFKDGKCPTCGNDAASIAAELANLTAEVQQAEVKERQAMERSRLKAIEATQQSAGIRALRAEIADETDWRTRLTNTKVELSGIDQSVAQAKTVEADIKREQAQKAAAEASLKTIEGELASIRKQLAVATEDVNHCQFWVRGFGNQGMPSFIMDTITPEFQERTNEYLAILTDGDITVQFDTESKLKGGEARDKFSIEALGSDISGRPSTGQQKKINIAADLGLMQLAASRERSGIDLLLLDEILDGLDASGKARVVDLLMELRKTRSSIFVISHDPSLAEIFEKTITVRKEGGEASVS